MQKNEPTKINISITINPARVDYDKNVFRYGLSKKKKTQIKKQPINTLPVMGYEVDLTGNIDE